MGAKPVRRWVLLALVAMGIAIPVAAAIPFAWDWFREEAESDEPPAGIPPNRDPFFNSPFITAGSMTPSIVAGFEAKLDDDEDVIGIEVGTRHRAYRLKAFKKPPFVVNDLIDGTPVTVTYCNQTRRAQAFTGPRNNAPLEMWLGGWINGSMILKLDQDFFQQATGQRVDANPADRLIVPILPHRRANWKTWRESHPDTDVCIDY
jgi:uncharacterized protein DUF3179